MARDATQGRRQTSRRLTDHDIRALIATLSDLREVIHDAGPADEAAI